MNHMAVEQPEPGVIDIQLDGHYTDGVYTALARIPGVAEPDEAGEPTPLAEIRMTFSEEIAGEAVAGLFQVFVDRVDDMIERIDEARQAGQ